MSNRCHSNAFNYNFFSWTQVTDYYWQPLAISTHMCILLVPLILINYIRNLKLLAPFSTLANLITLVGLGMVLSYMFDDLASISEREMFGTIRNFSLYFGTTLFALEAVGVVSVWRKMYIFVEHYKQISFLISRENRNFFIYIQENPKLTYRVICKSATKSYHVQLFIIVVCPEIFLKFNLFKDVLAI